MMGHGEGGKGMSSKWAFIQPAERGHGARPFGQNLHGKKQVQHAGNFCVLASNAHVQFTC